MSRIVNTAAVLVMTASGLAWAQAAEPPSVGRLKQMISRAASITPEQLERMVSAPAPPPKFHEWPTQPLTLVLMTPVRTGPPDDLRIPSDAPPTPWKLIRVLAPWLPGGRAGAKRDYASVIRPEYVTKCTRLVKGDTITGRVSFQGEKIYKGAVDYVAGLGPKGWRIEEFHLPKSGIRVLLTARGRWVARFPPGVQPLGTQGGDRAPPSVERLKQMISRAASITPEQFDLLTGGKAPVFVDWKTQPLTLVMMTPYKVVSKKGPPTDFKPLGGADAGRETLLRAVAPWRPRRKDGAKPDYASAIRPEYITKCTRVVKGDTITGTVSVRAEGAYEGAVDYVAGLGPKGWRIEELRLPRSGTRVVLTVRGEWVARFPAGVQPQGMQDTGEGPELEAYLPPEITEPVPLPQAKEIEINVRRDGSLVVAGKRLTDDELAEMLKRAAKRSKRTPVILRADRAVQYSRVISVLNACRKAGMNSVSFMAAKRPEKEAKD